MGPHPTNAKNLILPITRSLEKHPELHKEHSPANILTVAFEKPAQRAHLGCAGSLIYRNHGTIKVCCFKLLNLSCYAENRKPVWYSIQARNNHKGNKKTVELDWRGKARLAS